jgi:hypothetical protein
MFQFHFIVLLHYIPIRRYYIVFFFFFFFFFLLLLLLGWMIGVIGFDFRQVLGIFLFTTASRMALGPTQPPIQWVPGALSLGIKRPRREADHLPPSSAEVKE